VRVHPFFDLPTPHLFAHQGSSGEAPSNTIPAFRRAVELGIQYLETDCHATSDGEIVLCHDETVDRTTDSSGAIADFRFAELEKLDAGHKFTVDGQSFPFRGRGVRIPRLADVLAEFPQTRINLEIKQGDQGVVEEVIRIVRQADAELRVLLAAAEDDVMETLRKLDPPTAIGSSLGDLVSFYQAVQEERWQSYQPRGQALQIPPDFAGNSLITPEILTAAHELGLFVHVWTINDPAQMRQLLEAGVDGVMSDFPDLLLEQARAFAASR
jgi:glycerophosphoryl diester phosphodiesterase